MGTGSVVRGVRGRVTVGMGGRRICTGVERDSTEVSLHAIWVVVLSMMRIEDLSSRISDIITGRKRRISRVGQTMVRKIYIENRAY